MATETTAPRSFVTTRTAFTMGATIDDLMESVNPVKWVGRGLRVEASAAAWVVMFAGPRRWWCKDRETCIVYRTDSPAGRRMAPGLNSEFFVVFDTELADEVIEPVESIEQLAEIVVTCATTSSPEDRAEFRFARIA